MLTLTDVSKTYKSGYKAVKNLNLQLHEGEIFGFIGPNGAGKSTTLKMITGIIPPSEGSILINNIDLERHPVEAKRHLTFVPDHPMIYDGVSGMEYLNFIGDVFEVSLEERAPRVERFTRIFQIHDALSQEVSTYSHGMKQKLIICAALLPNPKLFILDEPHVGLDPQSIKVLKDVMREHCQNGGTVLFSSHLLEAVEHICDRVAIIHQGELLVCDTLENIKASHEGSLEEIFLEMTSR